MSMAALRYKQLKIKQCFVVDPEEVIKLLCDYLHHSRNPSRLGFVSYSHAVYRKYGAGWEKYFIDNFNFTNIKLAYHIQAREQYKEWFT